MQVALNITAGLLAGLLCALGGAIKDSPHEGFKPLTFMRSPVIGFLWGCVSIALTDNFFLAITFSGWMERVTVEGWKILRQQVPGKHEWKRRGEREWMFSSARR